MTERAIPITSYLAPIPSSSMLTASPGHSPGVASPLGGQSLSLITAPSDHSRLPLSSLPGTESMKQRILGATIATQRRALVQALLSNIDTGQILRKIISLEVPVTRKLVSLDLKGLLNSNCTDSTKLQAINCALSILEKYGKNLLKPASQRPKFWKSIKFANGTYREHISSIAGAQDVLKQFGYLDEFEDGLCFPDTEPDSTTVCTLLADILIAKFEIDKYRNRIHPFPNLMDEIVPKNARLAPAPPQPVNNPTSTVQRTPLPRQTPQQYENVNINESGDGEAKPALAKPTSSKHVSTMPSAAARSYLSQTSPHQYGSVKSTAGGESKVDSSANSKTEAQSVFTGRGVSDFIKNLGLNVMASLSRETSPEKEPAAPVQCDICGNSLAEKECATCMKQLCTNCDNFWHNHPRRRGHDTVLIQQVTSPTKREMVTKVESPLPDTSRVIPSIVTPKVTPVPAPRLKKSTRYNLDQQQGTVASPTSTPSPKADELDGLSTTELHTLLQETDIYITSLEDKIYKIILNNEDFSRSADYISLTKQKDHLKKKRALVKQKLHSRAQSLSDLGDISFPPTFRPQQLEHSFSYVNPEFSRPGMEQLPGSYFTLPASQTRRQDHVSSQTLPRHLSGEPMSFVPVATRSPLLPSEMSGHSSMIQIPTKSMETTGRSQLTGSGYLPPSGPPNTLRTNPPLNHSHVTSSASVQTAVSGTAMSGVASVAKTIECPACKSKGIPSGSVKCGVCGYQLKRVPHQSFSGDNEATEQMNKSKSAPSMVSSQQSGEGAALSAVEEWECEHCTFVNPSSTRICSMCNKTSDAPRIVGPTVEEVFANEREHENTAAPCQHVELVDQLAQEQDQVYYEKKAAHEAYQRQLELEQRTGHLKTAASPSLGGTPKSEPQAGAPKKDRAASALKPVNRKQQTERVQETIGVTMTHGDSRKTEEVVLASNDEVHAKNKRLELYVDGKETLRHVRFSDMAGFSMEEFDIATAQCEDKNPAEWLRQEWTSAVDSVVTSVIDAAHNMGITVRKEDIEPIAKDGLIESKGNVKDAVDKYTKVLREKIDKIVSMGFHSPEHVGKALSDAKGDTDRALAILNSEVTASYLERIWTDSEDIAANDHLSPGVEEAILNKNLDFERRARLVMFVTKIHFWGRAENVIKIVDMVDVNVALTDVIDAVFNCGDVERSLNFLQQECAICYASVPQNQILNLAHCQCSICKDCMIQYFTVAVKEKHVRDFVCPVCQIPDIDNEDVAETHLQFLDNMLHFIMDKHTYNLFTQKLRDWNLMKDPNFRWCAHCQCGFLYNGNRLKMGCPHCTKFTCFKCKRPWEDQHEDITCEQFQEWKEQNDPELQAAGLARHLEENGIDCPKCQFRYALARGGCMHFKCTQCRHEFCAGCYHPFKQGANCGQFKMCEKSGLHCHHPRDCLYYMRDNDVPQLQKLLTDNNVEFGTQLNAGVADHARCRVMEQKETVDGLKDERCSKDVPEGYAGLCEVHYKEYLVSLINEHKIDPVVIMNTETLKQQFLRAEKPCPTARRNESRNAYSQRLIEEIKRKFPLKPMRKMTRGVSMLSLNMMDLTAMPAEPAVEEVELYD